MGHDCVPTILVCSSDPYVSHTVSLYILMCPHVSLCIPVYPMFDCDSKQISRLYIFVVERNELGLKGTIKLVVRRIERCPSFSQTVQHPEKHTGVADQNAVARLKRFRSNTRIAPCKRIHEGPGFQPFGFRIPYKSDLLHGATRRDVPRRIVSYT